MHRLRWWLALLAALVLGAAPAHAQEVIRNFHADYAIQRDGSMIVTETIRVRAEGREIRRGIFRTLPTRYEDRLGARVNVGLTFLDAVRDGAAETADVSRQSNGVRIRLGDASTLLSTGEHSYRLRYRIERAVGRFDEYDELYWNVTGNDTRFPIERASATVRLPRPGGFTRTAVYTGRAGTRGKDAQVTEQDDTSIRFATTRRLGPNEGLTIAAAFPKGVIVPLGAGERLERKVADFAPPIGALLGFLMIAGYYYYAWARVGRDPRAGTVVPLFSPPDDLSPAAIRYLTRQQMDNRGFTAALVDSAIKGHVRLEEGKGGPLSKAKTTVHRLHVASDVRPLDPGEQAMLAALALPGQSVEMDQKEHKKFRAARRALTEPYEQRFVASAFHRNLGWAFAGFLFVIAGTWLAAAAVVWAEDLASSSQLLLSVAGVTVGALFFMGRPEQGELLRWPIIGIAIIAGVAGFLLGLPFIPLAFGSGNPVPVLVPLVGGGLLALSGFFWMDAPTLKGRAMLDRIAGFRQYLSTTEQERFDRMQPPREQLKLFERYLPYAIALGVENRWAERFEGALTAAARDPDSDRDAFLWYSGSRNIWSTPTGFANAVGSSMASAISSASTAPGSSSGSGGGGFSGGGGGGGGVGGW